MKFKILGPLLGGVLALSVSVPVFAASGIMDTTSPEAGVVLAGQTITVGGSVVASSYPCTMSLDLTATNTANATGLSVVQPSPVQTDSSGNFSMPVTEEMAGSYSVTLTATCPSQTLTAPLTLTWMPGAVASLSLTGSSSIPVGQGGTVQTVAEDVYGNYERSGASLATLTDTYGTTFMWTTQPGPGAWTYDFTAPSTAGTDTITATDSGITTTMSLDVVANPEAITVSAPSLTVNGTANLTVNVTNGGSPVSGALISLADSGGNVGFTSNPSGTTDSNGNFTVGLVGLTAGTDQITATDTSTGVTGSAQVTVANSAPTSTEAIAVTATPTSTSVNGTATISANVAENGSPASGVAVIFSAPSGVGFTAAPSGTTNANGNVSASVIGLTAGSYQITVTDTASGVTGSATLTVTSSSPVAPAAPAPFSLTVAPTTITAGATATASGQVVDTNGNPLSGCAVAVTDGASLNATGTTDTSANFAVPFTETTAGTYSITATVTCATGTVTSASVPLTVTAATAPTPTPVHHILPPPPPPPCVSQANLPEDFQLVSCVASLPGAGGTSTINYDTTKAQGATPQRVIVYKIVQDGTATRYIPTTLAPTSALVQNAPAGEYAVLLSTRTYSDTTQAPWAKAAVNLVTAAQAAVGFPGGSFQPNADATQGQIAKMIAVTLGLPIASTSNTGNWAAPYLASLDMVLGSEPYMVLRPGTATLTRGQFAAIMAQALHLVAGPVTEAEAIKALEAQDLMLGYTSGGFGPNLPITRAQVAMVLARWISAQAPAAN